MNPLIKYLGPAAVALIAIGFTDWLLNKFLSRLLERALFRRLDELASGWRAAECSK